MSTIAAQCPRCGRKGNVPDKALGRSVKCPGCANTFTVTAANGSAPPAASSGSATGEAKAWFAEPSTGNGAAPSPSADGLILARCTCGFQGRVPERYQGKQVKCRQCNQMFTVAPAARAPAAPAPAAPGDPPAAPTGGPAAKMGDLGDIALVPLEDEKPADADVTECEVIEEVEVVGNCNCPVCGHAVQPPRNFAGKKLRCPECLILFNVDGSADDAEEKAPPRKAGGSQAGVKKAAAAPPAEEVPAEEPASPFADLDAPTPKRRAAPARAETEEASPFTNRDEPEPRRKASPRAEEESAEERRPAFKSKRSDDAESRRQSTLILVGGSAVAILVLAGGLALVAAFLAGEKEKAAARATVPAPVAATRPLPPPTFQRPPTVVRKDPPVEPPAKKDPDPPVKKDPDPPVKDPLPVQPGEWADVSVAACRFGNARLRVTSVWVDDVKILLRGQAAGAAEDVLVIAYELENIHEKDPLQFFGWGSHKPRPGESAAVLTDSKGLPYKRLVLEDVEGQVQAKTLDPGQRVPDRLLFAYTDDKVEYYRLELPAANFGGAGMVRLQIPRSMVVAKVVRKDPDPVPKDDKKLAALRTQLRSRLAPDRIRACDELSKLRGAAAPAVPDLIKLYGSERNENVKVAILDAFKWIGPDAREAAPLLVRALRDEFWMVRREAAEALGTVGAPAELAKQALPVLKNLLTSKDEGVADAARGAIRRLENP